MESQQPIDTSHTEIRDYDPKWVEMYEQEAQKIQSLLRNTRHTE